MRRSNVFGYPDSQHPAPAAGRMRSVSQELAEVTVVCGTVLVLNHNLNLAVEIRPHSEQVEREGLHIPLALDKR